MEGPPEGIRGFLKALEADPEGRYASAGAFREALGGALEVPPAAAPSWWKRLTAAQRIMLGVPVLAVFGATDPNRTGPYGDGHRVVTVDDLDCRPCIARHCRRHDLACLDRIKSRQVADLALAMLDPRS